MHIRSTGLSIFVICQSMIKVRQCIILKKKQLTFRTQLLLTRRFPGLISLCNILAECKYFKPENKKAQRLVLIIETK